MRKFLSVWVVFFTVSGGAQNVQEAFARIMDAQTRQPVSYATIRFKNTNKGLIANEDGSFILPKEFIDEDLTLMISSIGYATQEVRTMDLSYKYTNNIYLSPKIEVLEAVELEFRKRRKVKEADFLSAERIVRQALYAIQWNYSQNPFAYVSYYRDYQIVEGKYVNLNEAIIKTFDEGISWPSSNNKSITSALLYYRLNQEFSTDSLLLRSNYGLDKNMSDKGEVFMATPMKNELEYLKIHNPVRNFDQSTFSFIYKMNEDLIENHQFRMEKLVYRNDELLYEISFVTNNSKSPKFVGIGKIYISKKSFAIHRLDYGVYDKGGHLIDARWTAQPYGTKPEESTLESTDFDANRGNAIFEVSVNYEKRKNIMFPSYITFNNRFEYQIPVALQVTSLTFDNARKAFYVEFDKKIDPISIKRKSNYHFFYRDRKLIVKDVILFRDNTLKIPVVWKTIKNGPDSLDVKDFHYRLKNIKDIYGGTLNETETIIGYQFRELFTQEIIEDEQHPGHLKLIDSDKYLFENEINESPIDSKKYWVNSPLKAN